MGDSLLEERETMNRENDGDEETERWGTLERERLGGREAGRQVGRQAI